MVFIVYVSFYSPNTRRRWNVDRKMGLDFQAVFHDRKKAFFPARPPSSNKNLIIHCLLNVVDFHISDHPPSLHAGYNLKFFKLAAYVLSLSLLFHLLHSRGGPSFFDPVLAFIFS